jgi:predicted nucleic acid-binding protein
MSGRVLVDTSIWIDFFRKKSPELIEKIALLLESEKAVYTGIIALELINGAKGQKELQALHDAFDTMERIDEGAGTYLNAGKMGYELARKGHTLGVVDLLIAQVAIENDFALMTFDEHFKVIAKHSGLRLF